MDQAETTTSSKRTEEFLDKGKTMTFWRCAGMYIFFVWFTKDYLRVIHILVIEQIIQKQIILQ